jgi:hypothetical protein
MFKQQPKLRKFVRANEQPIELNDQEKKLLKQIANLFSGAPGIERDVAMEVTLNLRSNSMSLLLLVPAQSFNTFPFDFRICNTFFLI